MDLMDFSGLTPERRLEALQLLAWSKSLELQQLTLEEWTLRYGERALAAYVKEPLRDTTTVGQLPLGHSIVEPPLQSERQTLDVFFLEDVVAGTRAKTVRLARSTSSRYGRPKRLRAASIRCDGASCPGCGLPNYEGLCPVCRGDYPGYVEELQPYFGPWASSSAPVSEATQRKGT